MWWWLCENDKRDTERVREREKRDGNNNIAMSYMHFSLIKHSIVAYSMCS